MQQTKILVCFFAIFACALASYDHHDEEGDESSYQFGYGVEDVHTGDIKAHHETKIGKHVSGVYTLREADGTTRIVKYTAGPHTGFNAVVEKEGVAQHPVQQHQALNLNAQPVVIIADAGVGGAHQGLHQVGQEWATAGVQIQHHGLEGQNLAEIEHNHIYAQHHQW